MSLKTDKEEKTVEVKTDELYENLMQSTQNLLKLLEQVSKNKTQNNIKTLLLKELSPEKSSLPNLKAQNFLADIVKKSRSLQQNILQIFSEEMPIGNNSVTRKDIVEMEKDSRIVTEVDPNTKVSVEVLKPGKELNRFLRCLNIIQNDDYLGTGDPASGSTYAVLSHVHGFAGKLTELVKEIGWKKAYEKWLDDPEKGEDNPYGWCIHGAEAFPEWHRIYMVTFERALQIAASKDPKPGRYDQEVRELNGFVSLPYWNWAFEDGSGYIPHSCRAPKATIDGVTIPNPLYKFNLASPFELYDDSDPPKLQVTFAYAGGDTRTPKDDYRDKNGQLQDGWTTAFKKQQIWRFLWQAMQCTNHLQFRGHPPNNTDKNLYTFEDAHNQIHNITGGCMTDVPYAAWDPIFWLHHCNVDRLLEVWYRKTYKDFPEEILIEPDIQKYLNDRHGPFYGVLKNPSIDITNSADQPIHQEIYFTYKQMFQSPAYFQYKYDNIDPRPFEPIQNKAYYDLVLNNLFGSSYYVLITHLTRRKSMNVNVFIVPLGENVKQNNYVPNQQYFVGAIGIFGGNTNKLCLNCIQNNRDNMSETMDATATMKSNNFNINNSKPYITITTPPPLYFPIDPEKYGIQAFLKQN